MFPPASPAAQRESQHRRTLSPRAVQSATALFRYLAARNGGQWEEVASNAAAQLYDAHEDSNSRSPEWHLEVDGAQVRAARSLRPALRATRGSPAGLIPGCRRSGGPDTWLACAGRARLPARRGGSASRRHLGAQVWVAGRL